jgi:hypothetical protein
MPITGRTAKFRPVAARGTDEELKGSNRHERTDATAHAMANTGTPRLNDVHAGSLFRRYHQVNSTDGVRSQILTIDTRTFFPARR